MRIYQIKVSNLNGKIILFQSTEVLLQQFFSNFFSIMEINNSSIIIILTEYYLA